MVQLADQKSTTTESSKAVKSTSPTRATQWSSRRIPCTSCSTTSLTVFSAQTGGPSRGVSSVHNWIFYTGRQNFNLIAYDLRSVSSKSEPSKVPAAEFLNIDGIADIGAYSVKLFVLTPSSLIRIHVSDKLEVEDRISTVFSKKTLVDNRVMTVTSNKLFISGRDSKNMNNYIAVYTHEFQEALDDVYYFKNQSRSC